MLGLWSGLGVGLWLSDIEGQVLGLVTCVRIRVWFRFKCRV